MKYVIGNDGAWIKPAEMDYDIASFSPSSGIRISDYFADGTKVGDWKPYLLAHEKAHALGGDEVDAALAELTYDAERGFLVNALRYVDRKRNLETRDAQISEQFFSRLERIEPEIVGYIKEFGDWLDKAGLYDFAMTGDEAYFKGTNARFGGDRI